MNSSVTEEKVRLMVENECARLGYKMLEVKSLPHPSDSYLRYVLAHNEKNGEYVTWLLNIELGGFSQGHYFNYGGIITRPQEEIYAKALDDFNQR